MALDTKTVLIIGSLCSIGVVGGIATASQHIKHIIENSTENQTIEEKIQLPIEFPQIPHKISNPQGSNCKAYLNRIEALQFPNMNFLTNALYNHPNMDKDYHSEIHKQISDLTEKFKEEVANYSTCITQRDNHSYTTGLKTIEVYFSALYKIQTNSHRIAENFK